MALKRTKQLMEEKRNNAIARQALYDALPFLAKLARQILDGKVYKKLMKTQAKADKKI